MALDRGLAALFDFVHSVEEKMNLSKSWSWSLSQDSKTEDKPFEEHFEEPLELANSKLESMEK